jgi:hypothetical protein
MLVKPSTTRPLRLEFASDKAAERCRTGGTSVPMTMP